MTQTYGLGFGRNLRQSRGIDDSSQKPSGVGAQLDAVTRRVPGLLPLQDAAINAGLFQEERSRQAGDASACDEDVSQRRISSH